jgi:cytochrome c553
MMLRAAGFASLLVIFCATLPPTAPAAPTAQQRQEIAAIGTVLTKAGYLYKDGKYQESGEAIKDAQSRLEKLAEGADEQLIGQLEGAYKRLLNAHALLELEGVKLPELKPLAKQGAAPAPGGTSFTKQVAPILVARCGNCHVRNTRGGLSMATYESLMKGSDAGKVVFPKDAMGSTIIEKIEGKEMPPNGAGIPDEELATLKKWISEGALYDGKDPAANLTSLVSGTPMPQPAQLEVKAATGKETVSFSKDVAPVLAQSCTGCHGMNQPRNNFSLNTFEGLLRGGDTGSPILPGKGADSLLVKKLRGTAPAGQRMPLNLPPLADDVIAKIEKWIDEGATYDYSDPKLPIAQVAALVRARSATHEQLSADRAKLAEENWRRSQPGIQADRYESANFLVLGNLGPNTLKEVADKAEALAPKVAGIFKAPADQPLVKGRVTLFVFKDRYDYGEFGKMVERRDLPPSWRGHFRFSVVDAYAAVLPPRSDDYSLEVLIGEQIAGCYVASLGKGTPSWFAIGAGRVAASRLDGGDARVAAWDDAVLAIVAGMPSPDAFLTGKLNPEQADIAAYSFVKFLMSDSRKFQALLEQLRKGADFVPAFSQIYGGSPSQLCELWVRKPPHRSAPARKSGKK